MKAKFIKEWFVEDQDVDGDGKEEHEHQLDLKINGSGLFFFNSTLDKETKLDILMWYDNLDTKFKKYVDILRNEAADEANFSEGDLK